MKLQSLKIYVFANGCPGIDFSANCKVSASLRARKRQISRHINLSRKVLHLALGKTLFFCRHVKAVNEAAK